MGFILLDGMRASASCAFACTCISSARLVGHEAAVQDHGDLLLNVGFFTQQRCFFGF